MADITSVFDNQATDWDPSDIPARGLLLTVDQSAMTVTQALEILAPTGNYSESQGDVQLLDNGNWFIGYALSTLGPLSHTDICRWGQQPWMSEYTSTGEELFAAQFGMGASPVQGYRNLKTNWTGYPTTLPNVSVSTNDSSSYSVAVSWNGATEVSYWSLDGTNNTSSDDGRMTISTANRTTFETTFNVQASQIMTYSWMQLVGYNFAGTALGYSDFVSTTDSTSTQTPAASQTVAGPTSSSSAATADSTLAASGAALSTRSLPASSLFVSAICWAIGLLAL